MLFTENIPHTIVLPISSQNQASMVHAQGRHSSLYINKMHIFFTLIILFCSYLVSKLLSIHIAKIIRMIFTCHDISLQNSLLVLLPFFNVESVWISKLLEILIYISEIMLPTSSTKRGLFLSGINCIITFLYNIRVSIHCSC